MPCLPLTRYTTFRKAEGGQWTKWARLESRAKRQLVRQLISNSHLFSECNYYSKTELKSIIKEIDFVKCLTTTFMMIAHLCNIDQNSTKVSSKKTWSTWARKSYGVKPHPAWIWVGPALGVRAKKFKIWSHGTKKNLLKNFFTQKLIRYHEAILWSFDAKIVFGAKQVGKIQIPDFTLSVGQKNQIDFVWSKSSLR